MENTIAVIIHNKNELKASKAVLEVYGYRKTVDFENNTPYYILADLKNKNYHSAWMSNRAISLANFIRIIQAIN